MSISMEQMEEVLESFNDHNVERIVSYFEEEGEFLMAAGPEPHGERFVGREAIGEVLRQRFAAVPDIRWAGVKTWVCGDCAVTEWRVQGTTAHGRLDCLGCDLWQFRDRKIPKKDTCYKQVIPS